MLRWLSEQRKQKRIARALYGSSVAAARREVFYRELRVPDTIGGRFELLVVHLFLVLDGLKADGPGGQELARQVTEEMFEALDDAMREMGIGDLTVPKKMHKAAGAFYGRLEAYAAAVAKDDPKPLEEALQRNVFAGEPAGESELRALAAYVRHAREALRAPGTLDAATGSIIFPDIEEKGA